MTEAQLTKKIKIHLEKQPGLWFFKCSDRYTSGIPDFIICHLGTFIAIEVKARNKKPRKLQEHVKACISKCGGIAFSVNSYESYLSIMEHLLEC